MRLLLDTHTFIWWDDEVFRLSDVAREAFSNSRNRLFLSVASIWELQIKLQLGRIALRLPLEQVIASQRLQGIEVIRIEIDDILALSTLPHLHRDPFDRLLIAQSKRGGYRLVTRDAMITQYDVQTLW